MDYLQLMYVLGLCSCFFCTKGEHVRLNSTRTKYNVGDTVTLTCYVRSNWLAVSFGRNNSELGFCSTKSNGCALTDDVRDEHGNYELQLEKSRPMLVIKNVTREDDGADFTCHWSSYTATISFEVTGEHVRFNSTRTVYHVGDTVTLTCYVRSSWLTVAIGRNNSDLGLCSSIINECASTADVRDQHGNYELKLEKSNPMLVIKNVTRNDDGADFTCHWTSYTSTISFAVTGAIPQKVASPRLTGLSSTPLGDTAVTTPSMHEENTSNSSGVIVVVSVILLVPLVVIFGVIHVIVKKTKYYQHPVRWFNDWQERRRRHKQGKAPVNSVDTEELEKISTDTCENLVNTLLIISGENSYKLSEKTNQSPV